MAEHAPDGKSTGIVLERLIIMQIDRARGVT